MVNVLNVPQSRAEYMIKNAKAVRRKDAKQNELCEYKRSITLGEFESAELFLMSAEYCEVYINEKKVISNDLREYAFDRAYRVLDVKPFLSVGENVIFVVAREAGRTVNPGFVCEVFIDGEHVDGAWKYRKDESANDIPHYISAGNEEICDMRKRICYAVNGDGRNDGFEDAEMSALVLDDEVKIHKSMKKAPMERVFTPKAVLPSYFVEKYNGQRLCLIATRPTVFISGFTATVDTRISVVSLGGIVKFCIDGKEEGTGKEICVSKGEHKISIFARGTCTFEVRCDDEISELSFKKLEFEEERAPFFFPFNERRAEMPIKDEIYRALMGEVDISDAPSAELGEMGIHSSMLLCRDEKKSDEYINCGDVNKKPVTIKAGAARKVVFDFGIEHIGLISFDICGPRGCAVDFNAFEIFEKKGERKMGPRAVGRVILSGERDSFVSRRLRGFRYVTLWIPEGCDITLYGMSVLDKRYPVSDIGAFSSSDKELDEIYKMSTETVSLCMIDNYVDCPGCEQNTWVGDAGITAMSNMVCFGEREFDAEYLDLIARSMSGSMRRFYRGSNKHFRNDTFLPCACFPTFPDAGIPIWSFTWVLQVIDHYDHFGADDGFEKRLCDVEECLKRCDSHMSDRGLFAFYGAWNLIEWADNDLTPYGEVTTNSLMLSYCYERVSKLMRERGEIEKAEKYLAKCNDIRAAVEKYCYNEEYNGYVDTVRDEYSYEIHKRFCEEHNRVPLSLDEYKNLTRISVQTATFALLFGNVSGKRRARCLDIVKNDVERGGFYTGTPANCDPRPSKPCHDIVRIGTPFFLYYSLRALFENGCEQLAVDVIRREWGAMLKDDVHTCVETFRRLDGEWGRSAAHAWSSAPAVYLKTEVLGIKPLAAGYKKFTVEPKMCGLTSVEGSVPTPYGKISVKCTSVDGEMTIECSAPDECERIYTNI